MIICPGSVPGGGCIIMRCILRGLDFEAAQKAVAKLEAEVAAEGWQSDEELLVFGTGGRS